MLAGTYAEITIAADMLKDALQPNIHAGFAFDLVL
jgi:hypothetical protein